MLYHRTPLASATTWASWVVTRDLRATGFSGRQGPRPALGADEVVQQEHPGLIAGDLDIVSLPVLYLNGHSVRVGVGAQDQLGVHLLGQLLGQGKALGGLRVGGFHGGEGAVNDHLFRHAVQVPDAQLLQHIGNLLVSRAVEGGVDHAEGVGHLGHGLPVVNLIQHVGEEFVIGLPAQQRGQEQQPLHHHCPDHRGGAPHRQGVEGQQRQGQEGSAAAVPPQELDGHPHQKGDVQAGNRHGMGQPGALEGPVVRVGQPGLVAGEEGPDQGRHLRREEGLHRPPQAPGPLGGPVSKGHPVRALHRQRLPIGVGPQEDAPGGAGLVGRAPDPIRRAEPGGEGQSVAGGEPVVYRTKQIGKNCTRSEMW